MVKHLLWFTTLFLVVGVWGKAANTSRPSDNQSVSPAVSNSLYFNYSKIQGNGQTFEGSCLSDDFNLPFLRSEWHTQSSNSLWTLKERPGYLRLKSQSKKRRQNFLNTTFSKLINLNHNGEAVSLIELSNSKESDETGLYLLTNEMQFIQVKTKNGNKLLEAKIGNNYYSGVQIDGDQIVLKLQVQSGRAWFEYSTDGLNFQRMGQSFSLNTINASQPGHVGLFYLNKKGNGGTIDIDWFYLSQDEMATQYTEVLNTLK